MKRKEEGNGEEKRKEFCSALGDGTGIVAFCQNASLQQGKGVRKCAGVFASSFREGLFEEDNDVNQASSPASFFPQASTQGSVDGVCHRAFEQIL